LDFFGPPIGEAFQGREGVEGFFQRGMRWMMSAMFVSWDEVGENGFVKRVKKSLAKCNLNPRIGLGL
jgi:hypothetical protein